MPRTKLKPNQEDYRQVSGFLRSVSWGSTCYLVYPLNGSRCCLMVPCSELSYLATPCHWSAWEQQMGEILKTAQVFNANPDVIFYGDDCSDYDCDRLNYEATKAGLIVHWNGALNQVRRTEFILRATDGIDLLREFFATEKE